MGLDQLRIVDERLLPRTQRTRKLACTQKHLAHLDEIPRILTALPGLVVVDRRLLPLLGVTRCLRQFDEVRRVALLELIQHDE